MQPKEGILNENMINTIKSLKKLGYNIKQIAFITNINEQVVYSIVNDILKTENIENKLVIDIKEPTKENLVNYFLLNGSLELKHSKNKKMKDLKKDNNFLNKEK